MTVHVAVRRPRASGVKVTQRVQLAPALRAPEQLVGAKAKSGRLLPPMALFVM